MPHLPSNAELSLGSWVITELILGSWVIINTIVGGKCDWTFEAKHILSGRRKEQLLLRHLLKLAFAIRTTLSYYAVERSILTMRTRIAMAFDDG